MKKRIVNWKWLWVLCLAMAITTLAGCVERKPAEKTEVSTNQSFEVEFLFEYEGVKVYRFYDGGRYYYYTNTKGETLGTETTHTGKTATTRPVRIPNN